MLNGSSWSEELDVFVGMELRQRRSCGSRVECFFPPTGCKIAATDARSKAEVEDGKHKSGGVMIAMFYSKVPRWSMQLEGQLKICKKEGRIAQM